MFCSSCLSVSFVSFFLGPDRHLMNRPCRPQVGSKLFDDDDINMVSQKKTHYDVDATPLELLPQIFYASRRFSNLGGTESDSSE